MNVRFMKKMLAIAASVAMVAAAFSIPVFADTATNITSLSQITNMSGNYKLTADVEIDASNWTPIGTSTAPFTGTFDGGGNTVSWSGTTAGAPNFAIFAASSGTVKNLNTTGTLTVSGSNFDYISAVVGYNSGTISNVTNGTAIDASSCYNVGGVAGFNNGYYGTSANGIIIYSSNGGAVTGKSKTGGIAGENSGIIAACSNSGAITTPGSGKNGVGGITGRNGNNNTAVETGVIRNCYNTGAVSADNGRWGGGIAGFNNTLSSVINCYSTVTATGYRNVDYIVGNNEGTAENNYSTAKPASEMNTNAYADGVSGSDLVWTADSNPATLSNRATGLTLSIEQSEENANVVYLDGYNGEMDGEGSTSVPYHNLAQAIEAAGAGGTVILKNTITINSNLSLAESVTFVRDSSMSSDTMFVVSPGSDIYVTLAGVTINGGNTGTAINVQNGRLRLRGNVELTNCATAVSVADSEELEVNYASITAAGRAVSLNGANSVFILDNFGFNPVSINGTVYLASGTYVTAKNAIPCTLTVECADSVNGTTIAIGSGYTLNDTDESNVTYVSDNFSIELDTGSLKLYENE